jgi:hypothetical protein
MGRDAMGSWLGLGLGARGAATALCAATLSALTAACGAPSSDGSDRAGGDDAAGAGGQGGGAVAGVGAGGGVAGAGGGDAPIAINQGFIGGPCTSDDDCKYDGGLCLKESAGFAGGMCTLPCAKFCPDQDGMVVTFCVAPDVLGASAAEGLCTVHCDYGASPTGCRKPGYQCQNHPRYADPATERYVCVPGEDAPFALSPCHEELFARGVAWAPGKNPLEHPEGFPNLTCDVEDPIWVEPFLSDVTFHPSSLDAAPEAIFTACPHALAMMDAAAVLATRGVTDLVHLGVYSCRVIAGTSTLSEHGRGNAIDIAGLKPATSGLFTVEKDWEKNQPSPTTPGGKLLRTFAETVFDQMIFNIVLTPDYNAAHYDHLHCDLTPDAHFFK